MRFIGRINIALFMFLLVIIAGTLGFRVLEPQVNSFLDSFFFTLTTVTTVGYGNIVPLTVAGKILAIGIIFAGVGSAMVALQGTFEVLVGKRIKEVFNLPDKRIEKQNHHIICGYGMVGKAIVRHLETLGLEFVVVEQDGGKVNRLVEAKVPVIEGDARQEKILEKAGIRKSRCLYATMDDSSNVFVALTAKPMNPGIRIISKSEDTFNNMAKLKKAGVDEVVACHDVGAQMMVKKGMKTETA